MSGLPEGERLEATVRGFVQGVGFRVYVARVARQLGLTGWVANLPDGSVGVVAEGGRKELDELEGLLRQGPSGAMIERVDAERSAARGNFDRFEIGARHHGGD